MFVPLSIFRCLALSLAAGVSQPVAIALFFGVQISSSELGRRFGQSELRTTDLRFFRLYFKHEFKCFIAISNNEKTIETRGPPGPSVLLFSSCLSSQ